MADDARLICKSDELRDGGSGVRFETDYFGEKTPAFAIRFRGQVRGYLNRCAHVPMELDWRAGEFFDHDGIHLICSTHGALYDAGTGRCAGGPCGQTPLVRLIMRESQGKVFCTGSEDD